MDLDRTLPPHTDDLGLDADSSAAKAQFVALGHVLARGSVTGTFRL